MVIAKAARQSMESSRIVELAIFAMVVFGGVGTAFADNRILIHHHRFASHDLTAVVDPVGHSAAPRTCAL
jgi:hypothetical protein